MSLLEVRKLRVDFHAAWGVVPVLDAVSFAVEAGETLGIVGESGCGKSVTALSILGLLPEPAGRIVAGQVLFEGRDLTKLALRELRRLRGNEIAIVFQDPMSSLNPVLPLGLQLTEALVWQGVRDARDAGQLAIQMLAEVGIAEPALRAQEYPHQMSGGMRQRALLAMALACRPKLLIADEPTTGLDATVQAQILDLLARKRLEHSMAMLLITHNLAVVAERCDRVVVMYAGQVAEAGSRQEILGEPAHPYTRGLLRSLPERCPPGKRLSPLPGSVPASRDYPLGCRFRTRCSRASAACERPAPLVQLSAKHRVYCHHPE
ncbi:MAG: ABC transporter ATP-binding protein [Proteobacteria bacterium]|nr:ABC transporter ATP-binding protein [Pseudomonadota bacterium]